MGRNGTFALVTFVTAALIVVALIAGWANWWVVSLVIIAAFVGLMGLIPRTRQPEVTGENKYHLHP